MDKLVEHEVDGFTFIFWESQKDCLNEKVLKAHLKEASLYPNQIGARFNLERFIHNQYFLTHNDFKQKIISFADKNLSKELTLMEAYALEGKACPAMLKNFIEAYQGSDSVPVYLQSSLKHHLPLFEEEKFKPVFAETLKLMQELSRHVENYDRSLFEKFSDFGLDLVARFELIRIHLLKFLAVLPTLDYDYGAEVKRLFLEAFRRLLEDNEKVKGKSLPLIYIFLFRTLYFVASILPARILALITRKMVETMAARFIAGENIQTSGGTLKNLDADKRSATLDQLGELVVAEHEADVYLEKVLELIDGVIQYYEPREKNAAGILRSHVSIKVSALCSDFKPHAFDHTYSLVAPRLKKILIRAKEKGVYINVDAEHYHFRDLVFEIYGKLLLETPELKDFADTGIVVQAYLRDGVDHLLEVMELAKKRNIRMPIRLVKGAYWDAETIEGRAHNFTPPQFLNKAETDLNFKQMVYLSLKNSDQIQLAVGSHNIEDHAFCEALRTELFPNAPVIEHQCLHMTYEALSMALSSMNYPTRNYMPIGNLLVGMAYLVRRIMENSSQVGILAQTRSFGLNIKFDSPLSKIQHLQRDEAYLHLSSEFKNVNPVRLYLKDSLHLVEAALKEMTGSLPLGSGDKKILSLNDGQTIVGKFTETQVSEIDPLMEKLFTAFKQDPWAKSMLMRAQALLHFAELMKIYREKLAALILWESGKTIKEALGDVDEAIDFVNFYVRLQMQLQREQGELEPKGIFAVIAPWNFPLAIPCGMVTAALVSGNSVIFKPAEQTPLIALEMMKLIRKAGIGENICSMVLGEAEIGKALTNHPLTVGVLFTGSKAVGTQIYSQMKKSLTSSRYGHATQTKTVVTEMGGKNAIIVTGSAEMDETVSGILYAAFAHAGQKCSAASRILVDQKVFSILKSRLVEAVKDLSFGSSLDFATTANGVITMEDKKRIQSVAQKIHQDPVHEGKILLDLTQENYPGSVVGPMIVEVTSDMALKGESYASKEIFGPVIHLIGFQHLDEAIKIFNATEYALTGGVYTQSQDDLDYLLPKLEAGNLYINRPNTGARVAIEPFGGFKLSGTGPKAGGEEYLLMLSKPAHEIKTLSLPEKGEYYQVHRYDFSEAVGDIFEFHQALLKDFTDLEWNMEKIYSEVRKIPGQRGFNDFHSQNGMTVIFTTNTAHARMLENILMSFNLSKAVLVMCGNEASHVSYSRILQLARKAGYMTSSFDVIRSDEKHFINFCKEDAFNTIILELGAEAERKVSEELTLALAGSPTLPRIFHHSETYWKISRRKFIFSSPRTYAINTMRHGAPLELGDEQ